MDRETAIKHRDVLLAWLDGAEIEARGTPTTAWSPCPNPQFAKCWEYRVKPSTWWALVNQKGEIEVIVQAESELRPWIEQYSHCRKVKLQEVQ